MWQPCETNESEVLIDDEECLALIDFGAQMSTITVSYAQKLGLKYKGYNGSYQ